MSKYVKKLITDEIRNRLDGVKDALLVNVIGLTANANNRLRARLAESNVKVMVVKNSLARSACEGTSLDGLFNSIDGANAICWGGEDIVSLAKVIVKIAKDPEFAQVFTPTGGIMDGEQLSPEAVKDVSKWPSREEQIAILLGQICGLGGKISAQICSPGAKLASQIKKKAGDEE